MRVDQQQFVRGDGGKGGIDIFRIHYIFQCPQLHLCDKLKLSSLCFISVVVSFVVRIPETVTWGSDEECDSTVAVVGAPLLL
jgi:hypothetical protein